MKHFVRVFALALALLTLGVALVSCGAPNADPAKATAALDEANYVTTKVDNEYALAAVELALGIDDLECVVTGITKEDIVKIYYFEEAEDAKEAYKIMEGKINKVLDDVDEDKVVSNCSGKMVYFGTKDAVKAAK